MNKKLKLILPSIFALIGTTMVYFGRKGQVSADVFASGTDMSYSILLLGAGFLIIVIAIIMILFVLASSSR